MSIFCFREALAYLGQQLRATFSKEIDKQEAEIKKKIKGEAQKAFMKCGSRHKKARSRKLFYLRVEWWGTFKIKYFKPKQSSGLVSKVKNWTENHRKTKICTPAMLKPYSASSFCLPNKNRVGVAHGDGTNLEVVYTSKLSKQTHLYFYVAMSRCCYASPEIVLKNAELDV